MNITQKPRGTHWTESEIETLKYLLDQGTPREVICRTLRRSDESVRCTIRRYHLESKAGQGDSQMELPGSPSPAPEPMKTEPALADHLRDIAGSLIEVAALLEQEAR